MSEAFPKVTPSYEVPQNATPASGRKSERGVALSVLRFREIVLAETPRGGNPPAQRQGMSHRPVGTEPDSTSQALPGQIQNSGAWTPTEMKLAMRESHSRARHISPLEPVGGYAWERVSYV
jgi:hypothetical protein